MDFLAINLRKILTGIFITQCALLPNLFVQFLFRMSMNINSCNFSSKFKKVSKYSKEDLYFPTKCKYNIKSTMTLSKESEMKTGDNKTINLNILENTILYCKILQDWISMAWNKSFYSYKGSTQSLQPITNDIDINYVLTKKRNFINHQNIDIPTQYSNSLSISNKYIDNQSEIFSTNLSKNINKNLQFYMNRIINNNNNNNLYSNSKFNSNIEISMSNIFKDVKQDSICKGENGFNNVVKTYEDIYCNNNKINCEQEFEHKKDHEKISEFNDKSFFYKNNKSEFNQSKLSKTFTLVPGSVNLFSANLLLHSKKNGYNLRKSLTVGDNIYLLSNTSSSLTKKKCNSYASIRNDYLESSQINESYEIDPDLKYHNNNNLLSNVSTNKQNKSNNSKKKNYVSLPRGCVVLAWMFVILSIIASFIVSIFFTYTIDLKYGFIWLQIVFFSFIQCFFINQPLLILILTCIKAFRYRYSLNLFDQIFKDFDYRNLKNDKQFIHKNILSLKSYLNEEIPEIDKNNYNLWRECKIDVSLEKLSLKALDVLNEKKNKINIEQCLIARQRSRYLRLIRPPQEKKLIEARHQTMKESNAKSFIRELISIGLQLMIVLFICFGNQSREIDRINSEFSKKFILSESSLNFKLVRNIQDWLNWYEMVYLKSLIYYQKHNFILVGPNTIRQKRVMPHQCSNFSRKLSTSVSCQSVFKDTYESTDFFFNFGQINYNETIAYSASNDTFLNYWKYINATKTTYSEYVGTFGVYDGSGYIINLPTNENLSLSLIKSLFMKWGWVNQQTSIILLSTTFFHPPTNIFTSIVIVVETPPLSQLFPSFKIASIKVYRYQQLFEKLILMIEMVFFLATLIKLHTKIYFLLQKGIESLRSFWNFIEISQISLSLVYIACYIARYWIISQSLDNLTYSYFQQTFADVFLIDNWDQLMKVLISLILFCISIQIIKCLQRFKLFGRLSNILTHSFDHILVLLCFLIIWSGAYICCGMILFGSSKGQFSNFSQAFGYVLSLLKLSTKNYFSSDINSYINIKLWYAYNISFVVIAFSTMNAYVKSSIIFNYLVYKEEPFLTFSFKQNIQFYIRYVKETILKDIFNKNAHKKETNKVCNKLWDQLLPEFTMAEVESQVDEVLLKMNSLSGISNMPTNVH